MLCLHNNMQSSVCKKNAGVINYSTTHTHIRLSLNITIHINMQEKPEQVKKLVAVLKEVGKTRAKIHKELKMIRTAQVKLSLSMPPPHVPTTPTDPAVTSTTVDPSAAANAAAATTPKIARKSGAVDLHMLQDDAKAAYLALLGELIETEFRVVNALAACLSNADMQNLMREDSSVLRKLHRVKNWLLEITDDSDKLDALMVHVNKISLIPFMEKPRGSYIL